MLQFDLQPVVGITIASLKLSQGMLAWTGDHGKDSQEAAAKLVAVDAGCGPGAPVLEHRFMKQQRELVFSKVLNNPWSRIRILSCMRSDVKHYMQDFGWRPSASDSAALSALISHQTCWTRLASYLQSWCALLWL